MMIPPVFEAACDVCFAAEAVKQSGATGRRPVLLEELSRRAEVLHAELERLADASFHAGLHRSKRSLAVLLMAVQDWLWSGADPSPDDEAGAVVAAAIRRVGQLMQAEAPKPAQGGATPGRSTSKTISGGAES